MCNNNSNNGCSCISEILTVICILQQNADTNDCCLDTCDKGFLGCSVNCPCFNTRPIKLYTCGCNGTPWSMPTSKEAGECGDIGVTCSDVFRVEKVDGCCCTFRVLAPNTDETQTALMPYVATNCFFTMDLNCCCAIRCLPDTIVDCL